MSDFVDFKAIKLVASIGTVAARYGIELQRVNASHERGKCPLPEHPAGDINETFSVNAGKQVWICHSKVCAESRKGKKGGDVIELVAFMERCTLREAGIKLGQWFSVSDSPAQTDSQSVAVEKKSEGQEFADFGIYTPLGKWIEKRLEGSELHRFEQSAYLSVLGKIEELTADKNIF